MMRRVLMMTGGRGPVIPVVPQYTGFIAARGHMPLTFNAAHKQANSRCPLWIRESVTSLQVIIPNFMMAATSPYAEAGSGAALGITASIEYPAGTRTQVLFSGIAQGSVPDGEFLVSDPVSITIPANSLIGLKTYQTSTAGVWSINLPMGSFIGSGIDSRFTSAASGLSDQTMSASVGSQSSTNFAPLGIIGTTTRPSFIIVGDSISYGQSDATAVDATGDFGSVARSLGSYYGYTNLSRSGHQANKFISSHTQSVGLFQYASHLLCAFGSNDLYTLGSSAAVALGNLQTIWGYMTALGGGRKAYQTTITPRTTSSDGWQTTANQTKTSGDDKRLTLNASIRGLATGLDGYFDIADAIESARDSGFWTPSPSSNYYTSDGTHPNTPGYLLTRDSRKVVL